MRCSMILVAGLALAGCRGEKVVTYRAIETASHPLDPLTAAEIRTARRVLKESGKLGEDSFVPVLVLNEPSKRDVKAFRSGPVGRREAFVVALDRPGNAMYEAVIDIAQGQLVSWTQVVGAQPHILEEEFDSVPEIVRADPEWRKAMVARGITDFNKVYIDTWAAGVIPVPGAKPGARLTRAISFWKNDSKNPYGRPIEGVVAVVDVNDGKVIQVVDSGVRHISDRSQDFDAGSVGRLRPATGHLQITQPRGVGFVIRGQEVRWQKWVFRFALHPREGLVLYQVGYEDEDRLRSILYRASVSEMVVPYADPDANWVWRNAFDEGEYGLGRFATSLEPTLDAPMNAVFCDAVMADEQGEPRTLERAVALYERDADVLWTHNDAGTSEGRRAEELVLYCAVTIGNYDYGLAWIFRQDGTIEAEVMASGILLAKGSPATGCSACVNLAQGKDPTRSSGEEQTGTLVDRHIVAPNHQHFFNFRLDFDIEDEANSVVEMNIRPLPAGPGNPHENGFGMEETLLETEGEGMRDMDFHAHRMWKVFNPGVRNELGHLAGYLLVPGENSQPYMGPTTATRRRAEFIGHHLWVTRFNADETYAAGPYPNQNQGGDGLPRWIQNDESLVNSDVVVWYTTCLTHVPRPEEWPIMGAARIGFKLMPSGFFARNPALDVPPR
jgi:primary-amine oxidase